jgi:hypothetical protein
MEWQTIETAPKDETSVLLFVRALSGHARYICIGCWINDDEGKGAWDSDPCVRWPNHDVTHWMPLPTPPEVTK